MECDDTRLLVDAGFSARETRRRLASLERSPERLDGILITHEHSDHIGGLLALARKLEIPVYCNRATQEAIQWSVKEKLNYRIFATGASFDVGGVFVETFSVPHDAADPVGFVLRTPRGSIAFATDLGHVTKLVLERIRPANVLVLETNHDVKMLQNCPRRPWSLKQRILGRHGHLSNEAAADTIEQVVTPNLRHVYLGHLSRECNNPDLAMRVMTHRVERLGAAHVELELTNQTAPCRTLQL